MRPSCLAGVCLIFAAFPYWLTADEPGASPENQGALADRIRAIVQPLVEQEALTGAAVGVLHDSQRETFGFGRFSARDDRRPDADTVFEIGSVSKVFTALALAEMAEAGLLGLADPVQQYLPAEVQLAKVGDAPITLADLASHASGLPRMPDNFAPADPNNPYADYNAERLLEFLKTCRPARGPGEQIEYSNLGAGLLGYVLARREDNSYERLVLDRIAKPLEITDLRVALTADMRSRLAPGHNGDGEPVANWDLDALAGAGGLRSTVKAMLDFLAANLAPDGSPLGSALKLARQPRHSLPGGAGQIGLGWHITADGRTCWHNGETGGYHSLIAFDPEHNTAVVVLANSASGLVDAAGFKILELLNGGEPKPIPVRKAVAVAAETLKDYIGKYELSPTFHIDIAQDGDKLYLQATDQPRFRIFAESETRFFLRVVDAVVEFRKNEAGHVDKLVLFQNGAEIPGRRVDTK